MKPLILLLALPLCLFAQVEVDTIVDLGHNLFNGHYIPELNKLYVMAPYYVVALNCSTWQKTAEFPTDAPYGGCRFVWNPVRSKLYVALNYIGINSLDSTLVIDVRADTAWWIATRFRDLACSASRDRLYGAQWGSGTPILVLDCATDSLVDSLAMPIPGYEAHNLTLDSVNGRLYASLGAWLRTPHLAVFSVPSGSLYALHALDCSSPGLLSFHYARHKAYFMSDEPWPPIGAGVLDTDSAGLIRLFPFRAYSDDISNNGHGSVAVNYPMDKVYIGGNNGRGPLPTSCTLFVVDCATDSILKEIEFLGRGAHTYVVWVPWSNRVYYDADDRFHMAVLDCENDSVINPELVLPGQDWAPIDLLLDAVRERIFAIGADTTAVHVLRDVQQGVEEPRGSAQALRNAWAGPTITSGVLLLPDRHPAHLLDVTGRKVMDLWPGENDIRGVAPGVYFVRSADSGGRSAVTRKVIIQR